MMNKNTIFDIDGFVTQIKETIQDLGTAFARIVILFVDVILGQIMFSALLTESTIVTIWGIDIRRDLIALFFSISVWAIQINLWKRVLSRNVTPKLYPVIGLAVLLAIADTFTDSSVIRLLIGDTVRTRLAGIDLFGVPYADVLEEIFFWIAVVISGTGEFLDQLMVQTKKNQQQKPQFQKKSPRPRQPRKPIPPNFRRKPLDIDPGNIPNIPFKK